MATPSMTRRSILALGGPAALAALAACSTSTNNSKGSSSSSGSSLAESSSSAATSSSAAAESSNSSTASKSATASASASGGQANSHRDKDGYHLNKIAEGKPVVTMYTDYQCPHCAKAAPTYEKVAQELDGTMNLTVKNFPLVQQHKHAALAAKAVIAAENQGKHSEMANRLYTTQSEWQDMDNDGFSGVLMANAVEFKLDIQQFATDTNNSTEPITEEYKKGVEIGVKGTPSFVVNGKVLDSVDASSSAEDMVKAFKEAGGAN